MFFMVRTHLWKIIKDMMKLEYFLPNSIFLKHLEKHVAKAEAIIYGQQIITLILWKKTIWKFHGMIIPSDDSEVH